MNLRIAIADSVSPQMQSVMRLFTSGKLTELHQAAGTELQQVTVEHISKLASTRHASADRLGAAPTGHLAQAAEKVAAPASLSAGPAGATLTINHPGFTRAFRSVKIVPRSANTLAIPIHASAYGKRAAEIWDRMGLFIPKGKRIIAATIGGVVTPMYILVKNVTQPQDRTLLPSDEEFTAAAVAGAKGWLGMALAKGGKL